MANPYTESVAAILAVLRNTKTPVDGIVVWNTLERMSESGEKILNWGAIRTAWKDLERDGSILVTNGKLSLSPRGIHTLQVAEGYL